MKSTFICCAVLGLMLGLSGCNKDSSPSGGYVPKKGNSIPEFALAAGQEASIFPFKEGNEWVFEVSSIIENAQGQRKQGGTELTFKCVKVETDAEGATLAQMDITQEGAEGIQDRQIWKSDKTGVYQVSIGNPKEAAKTFSPPQIQVPFPLEVGKKFSWVGSGPVSGGVAQTTMSGTVTEVQLTDVKAGTFNAMHIEQMSTWKDKDQDGMAKTQAWWVPNVGLIKLMQEIKAGANAGITKIELKSTNLITKTAPEAPSTKEK